MSGVGISSFVKKMMVWAVVMIGVMGVTGSTFAAKPSVLVITSGGSNWTPDIAADLAKYAVVTTTLTFPTWDYIKTNNFDQVWDYRDCLVGSGPTIFTALERPVFDSCLANSKGVVVITGSGDPGTNRNLEGFVNTVTGATGTNSFIITDNVTTANVSVVDTAGTKLADPAGYPVLLTPPLTETDMPAGVKIDLSKPGRTLAGGYSLFRITNYNCQWPAATTYQPPKEWTGVTWNTISAGDPSRYLPYSSGITFNKNNSLPKYTGALFIFTSSYNLTQGMYNTRASTFEFITGYIQSVTQDAPGIIVTPDDGSILNPSCFSKIEINTGVPVLGLTVTFDGTTYTYPTASFTSTDNTSFTLNTPALLNPSRTPGTYPVVVNANYGATYTPTTQSKTVNYTFVAKASTIGLTHLGLRQIQVTDNVSASFNGLPGRTSSWTFSSGSSPTNGTTTTNGSKLAVTLPSGSGPFTATENITYYTTPYVSPLSCTDQIGPVSVYPLTLLLDTNNTLPGSTSITVKAGSSITIRPYIDSIRADGSHVKVADYTKYKTTFSEVISPTANGTNATFAAVGDAWTFQPKTVGSYTVTGTFTDKATPNLISTATLIFNVVAGPASQLTIEQVPTTDPTAPKSKPGSPTTLTISGTANNVKGYAYLWDANGNFVSAASSATAWTIQSGTGALASVTTPGASSTITKKIPLTEYSGVVQAKDGAIPAGTVVVNIQPRVVDGIRIVASTNMFTDISGTSISIPVDTISPPKFFAQMHYADIADPNDWSSLPSGSWSNSNLSAGTLTNLNTDNTTFIPKDIGTTIITLSGAGYSKTVTINVTHGNPASLIVYHAGQTYSGRKEILTAGTPFTLDAKLFDASASKVQLTEAAYLNAITWEIIDSATNLPLVIGDTSARISPSTGAAIQFTGTKAKRSYIVKAHYNQLVDNVLFTIVPAADTLLRIVHNISDSASLNLTAKPTDLVLTPADTITQAYAVIIDRFGNFKGFPSYTDWISLDNTIVTAAMGATASLYSEGNIFRKSTTEAETLVVATYNSYKDTVRVKVQPASVTGLHIYVHDKGKFVDITSMTIRSDLDTTIYVRQDWSDGAIREDVASTWDSTGTISYNSWIKSSTSQILDFASAGTGTITAFLNGRTATITINVDTGLANSISLYKTPTWSPAVTDKYRDPIFTDTVVAGTAVPLTANVFDHLGIPIGQYYNTSKTDSITWEIIERGTTTKSTGLFANGRTTVTVPGQRTVEFTPTVAWRSVMVKTSLSNSNLSDTVTFYIKPASPNHISIEATGIPTTANLNNAIKYTPITLGQRDSSTGTASVPNAYAILRDNFQNFIRSANNDSLTWAIIDTSVASVKEETPTLGEAKIRRETTSGTTKLVVHDIYQDFFDTVIVDISDVSYDTLMIVGSISDTTPFTGTISLLTGQSDSLYAKGLNSATGKWDLIRVNWSITSGLVTALGSGPANVDNWIFTPQNTGTGYIIITKGSGVPDSVYCDFKPGQASAVEIWTAKPDVAGAAHITLPQTITAGATFPFVAHPLDINGNYLIAYENQDSAGEFLWAVLDDPDTAGVLFYPSGMMNNYIGKKAGKTIRVQVMLEGKSASDEITLTIVPNRAYQLFLEGSSGDFSPNKANPLKDGDIIIPGNSTTFNNIFANLRDSLGNYVNPSTMTQWTSFDTSALYAEAGNTNFGQGILTRNPMASSDTVLVSARDINPLLSMGLKAADSVKVYLIAYTYDSLRIVRNTGSNTLINDTTISTNDNLSLFVKGKRSDNGQWELVSASWRITDTLSVTPFAPNATSWTFSPDKPGKGIISVTIPGISAVPDTMSVTFTTGAPGRIVLDIPDDGSAGDPINGTITIYNKDGKVVGPWTGTVVLGDLLGTGAVTTVDGKNLVTGIIVNGDTLPFGTNVTLNFTDGTATFKLLIFTSGTHTITVDYTDVDNTTPLTDSATITITPGAIKRIRIVSVNGDTLPSDTVIIPSGDYKQFGAHGYDYYGNDIGMVSADWVPGTAFTSVNYPTLDKALYQLIADGIESGEGWLTAAATTDSLVADSVWIIITPPAANMTSAPITRDTDGDGWLDRIDIILDRGVALPDSGMVVSVTARTTSFATDSITAGYDSLLSANVIRLYLTEDSSGTVPQTGWRPLLTITGVPYMTNIEDELCADGAGPVLYRISKKITYGNIDKPTDQEITVVFSEPVFKALGSNLLTAGRGPDSTLAGWRTSGSGWTLIDGLFTGAIAYNTASNDSVFTFKMPSDTQSLESYHWVNLLTTGVVDRYENAPVDNNRRVKVGIEGDDSMSIAVGPNPMVPSSRHLDQTFGELKSIGIQDASDWVTFDAMRGTIIDLTFVPQDSGLFENIQAQLMIFDAVGNLAVSQESADNLEIITTIPGITTQAEMINRDLRQSGGVNQIHISFYWSGYLDTKAPAAIGTYRATILLKINGKQHKLTKTIVVTR